MSDVNTLITGLLPDLHTPSIADLTWWTKAELIEWADEAVKRAARSWALFIARDANQVTGVGQGSAAHLARYLVTLHVSIGNRSLRASSSAEMAALDLNYLVTQGDPEEHWFEDKSTSQATRWQPVSQVGGRTIRFLYTEFPAELDTGELNTTIPGPLCFGDYIQNAMRAEADAKESDAAMPEVAKHDRELMALYESLFDYYWGTNQ